MKAVREGLPGPDLQGRECNNAGSNAEHYPCPVNGFGLIHCFPASLSNAWLQLTFARSGRTNEVLSASVREGSTNCPSRRQARTSAVPDSGPLAHPEGRRGLANSGRNRLSLTGLNRVPRLGLGGLPTLSVEHHMTLAQNDVTFFARMMWER